MKGAYTMKRTKTGIWLLNDVEMLLYFIYAKEAVKNFSGDEAKAIRAEAQGKADFIGMILKEAKTLPVNFTR